MRSFAVIAGLFAASAIANPAGVVKRDDDPCDDNAPPCMTYDQASVVANNFKTSIADYSDAFVEKTFAQDFVDYSDSVSELINGGCTGPNTLGQPTFPKGLANFEKGQGSQPAIPFEILNLWHTCDTVIMRWRSAQTPEIVTGNIVLETKYQNSTSEPFLIQTTYSEFNSGAWLVNLGQFKPNCSASTTPTKRSAPFKLPVRML